MIVNDIHFLKNTWKRNTITCNIYAANMILLLQTYASITNLIFPL